MGLTATAEALDNYLVQIEQGKTPSKDEVIKLLEQASANIRAIDAAWDKIYKIIS